jgi:hypothetical protein
LGISQNEILGQPIMHVLSVHLSILSDFTQKLTSGVSNLLLCFLSDVPQGLNGKQIRVPRVSSSVVAPACFPLRLQENKGLLETLATLLWHWCDFPPG